MEEGEHSKKKKTKRNQETDFHSVEINTTHFDTVKCKRFIMEILKRSWKVVGIFNSQKSINAVIT